MTRSSNPIDVYLEIGKKRILASALEWPGWCRGGRDEGAALQALFDYGPRYAHVLGAAGLGFQTLADVSAFAVVERLAGDASTDFGTPGLAPSGDARPVDDAELRRFETLLQACWQAFDAAAQAASGKELRKGPRGGGRDLRRIVRHVLDADTAYLERLGWKVKQPGEADPDRELSRTRQAIRDALAAAARGQISKWGPRGRALAAALLCPPRGLARARSRLGDRGPLP